MIYLSICIPTYNRSNYLENTINSIISQQEFIETEEVEIVVSDNCSTDDTENVMKRFLLLHPSKIKYHRNKQNIMDANFEKVLSLGQGKMLKLNNDTLLLNPEGLGELLKIVKYCIQHDQTPFLTNGKIPHFENQMLLNSKISFIKWVSFYCTWIGAFCISRESFKTLDNFSRDRELSLVQVDVIMRLLERNQSFLVVPDIISTSIVPEKKGGYSLPKVFLTNYFIILGRYFTTPEELKVLAIEKKKTLYEFVLPWVYGVKIGSNKRTSIYKFDIANYRKIIKQEFSFITCLYFEIYLAMKMIIPKTTVSKVKRFFNKEIVPVG